MLALFLAIVIVNPSPAPTPVPVLKTIITVKSSPFCGAFAAHVNSAISSAVDNDQTLSDAIVGLRSDDLAGSTLKRENEIRRLEDLSDAIYKQYRSGEGEVNQLRALASKTTDPNEKLAVDAAADALGGALYRQHLVQKDLQGFTAFLNASDMMQGVEGRTDPDVSSGDLNQHYHMEFADQGLYWVPSGFQRAQSGMLVGRETLDDDLRMAQAASDDFQRRMSAIFQDEMSAGTRIETAGDHCGDATPPPSK